MSKIVKTFLVAILVVIAIFMLRRMKNPRVAAPNPPTASSLSSQTRGSISAPARNAIDDAVQSIVGAANHEQVQGQQETSDASLVGSDQGEIGALIIP